LGKSDRIVFSARCCPGELFLFNAILPFVKINLRFLKKNRLSPRTFFKKAGKWVSQRPLWVKFVVSVLLLSTLASLLAIGLYDRFYGSSPISNKGRLVKEALAVCDQAQTLASTAVDFQNWPLENTFDLEGQGLATAVEYFANYSAYSQEGGPSAAEAFTASAWLKENYPDYFSSQERCDTLVQEYQSKYAY